VTTTETSGGGAAIVRKFPTIIGIALGALAVAACGDKEGPTQLPVIPATGLDFASVMAGGSHTCGLTTTGTVYCWGDNSRGQLGTGTTASSFTPVPVGGNLTFNSLSAGALHTCGVATEGTAYCWGFSPPLGADSATLNTCPSFGYCVSPVPVAGGRSFSSVSADYWHTCGVTTDGAAYCWGFGNGGVLGADAATMLASNCELHGWGWNCLTPVPVSGGLIFTSVSAGVSVTCGLTATGALYCWGANFGQLGIGTTEGPERCPDGEGGEYSCSHIPVAVAGGLSFTDVTALNTSACGLATGGAGYCWGPDYGSVAPVAVAGGHSFTAIARGGNSHTCAITATGAAYCWGHGALGHGTIWTYSATPVPVSGGLSFQLISASQIWGSHTCGLAVDRTAYCWGANSEGQLGTGTTTSSSVPVKVAGQRQ
jgi:alpha-tubulin suppressor-like RCC1 family protein